MTALAKGPLAGLRRAPLGFRLGLGLVVFHLLLAAFGPWLAPYGPSQMRAGPPLSGASLAHLMGTDQLGRDVFSRALCGAPVVLFLSVAGTLTGCILGGIVGLLSGYRGGWLDACAMRVCEALVSIPVLLMTLFIVALAGTRATGTMVLIVLAIGFVYAPRVVRVARVAAMEVATRDFVAVAALRGDSAWRVVTREIMPNAAGVLLVEMSLRLAYAPVLVASLGFLGFGLKPPTPEWGLMISENRGLIYIAPVTALGPGLLLATLVVGVNLLTEGVARMIGRNVERRAAP